MLHPSMTQRRRYNHRTEQNEPGHKPLVLEELSSIKCSSESEKMRRLTKTFAALIYKIWMCTCVNLIYLLD